MVLLMLIVVFLFCSFHALKSTAEMYLTPALEKISQALRCSETLAGVTLVALGNGAPETIIAVTSGGNAENDFSIAIGTIFGCVLFGTSYMIYMVLKENKGRDVRLDPHYVIRDVMF